MAKGTRKNNKSLWEKSIKLVMNITKVSALSLAEKSLGTKPLPLPLAAKAPFAAPPPPPYFTESRRSQEPESASKPSSYVMELPEEIYMIREDKGITNVDGRASDYIRWFHERIQNDSIDAAKLSPIILPLPPRPVK